MEKDFKDHLSEFFDQRIAVAEMTDALLIKRDPKFNSRLNDQAIPEVDTTIRRAYEDSEKDGDIGKKNDHLTLVVYRHPDYECLKEDLFDFLIDQGCHISRIDDFKSGDRIATKYQYVRNGASEILVIEQYGFFTQEQQEAFVFSYSLAPTGLICLTNIK